MYWLELFRREGGRLHWIGQTANISRIDRQSPLAGGVERFDEPFFAEDPPRTFHEALQFTWIVHQLIEMEGEWVRSMGHFDRTLYPYYAADIEAGRLDRDTAKELNKFYWMKWYSRTRGEHNGKNFLFGGQYRDGSPVELMLNDGIDPGTGDSLAAVKQVVFEDHWFTTEEILEAVRSDYDGNENMRRYLLESCPKWGNDNGVADALGKQVADLFCDTVHGFRNGRGGRCQAALFTLTFAWEAGLKTGALPGGRRAGTSLAPGTGAAYGRDREGVTALLKSVSKFDAKHMPNGSVLDVTLHPTAVEGDEGLDAMVSLIRTYFQAGGYALQFNIYDADLLREAQREPEKHASLQIRLTGWSVYFAGLTKFEQDRFIVRISHRM